MEVKIDRIPDQVDELQAIEVGAEQAETPVQTMPYAKQHRQRPKKG